ncbi:glycosyltransferase family 4 protein [Phocaeicola plebeius]|jgi:glycosyltransferase involved in cell wall biosynthesis|uniref:glycosyltransferase family 4 protein n=1 Tax=Phocaeicola plebeius TaxID=310297 RepID=UPI0026F23EFF|nr:glycosyltransferase family 4 protein [Phocaeicola plebeius]
MKVLYCNPIFFEYRLPFYKELVRLFKGQFYVMYSVNRYDVCGKSKFCKQIKEELGNNAIPFYKDYIFDTYSMSFKMKDIEKGKRIPLTFGLLRAIYKIKPDVLITEGYFQWTPLVLLYSIIFRVPIYMGYERTLHTERNTGKFKTWQRKLFNKYFTGFLVNGQETKKYLESLGVIPSKIHIGGMSADAKWLKFKVTETNPTDKINWKKYYIKDENGLLYLFSGRISEPKGVHFLLHAWEKHIKQHPKDALLLIGYGNKYEEFKEKYRNEKSVHLIGQVNYSEIYKFYAISDVFILPTLQDNWSLVVPEAMACGLPIATSIYNGCYPELVHKDENGITFDPCEEETLINALDYFHHQDLKVMGQKSIELEKQFNTENCARRVYEALNKSLSK